MRRRDAGPVPEAVRRRGEQAGADLRLAAQVRRAAAAAGQRRAALQVRGHHAGRLQEAGESVGSSGEPREKAIRHCYVSIHASGMFCSSCP